VLRGCSVEDVSFRGTLLLLAVRVVVRDADWRTVPVRSWSAHAHPAPGDGLRVDLAAEHDDLGAGVSWRAELTAGRTADGGRLGVAVTGEVTRAFRRNRLGLVVLHPAALAGTPLRVTHPDGSRTAAEFPADVAPHQPARDVAGLAWRTGGGDGPVLAAELALTGDVFEVEDQRNWTDASFKTYSTPLDRPFPVALGRGSTFAHGLELTVVPDARATPTTTAGREAPASDDVVLTPAGRPLPRVQLTASTAPGEAPGLPWWRGPVLVELDATGRAWPGVLARARAEAGAGGLDVRVTAAVPDQLDPVLAALHDGDVEVLRVGVHDAARHVTTAPLWERLLQVGRDLPLVGGTRAHFTELNRGWRDLPPDLPALTFSSTPQMHDTGRAQLLAAPAVQRTTAEQAVRLAGGRPVHVGPVTLRPRFNAVATSARRPADEDVRAAGTGAEHVWQATDPRQAGRGAAAWFLAAHQAFAVAGVATLTLAETFGPRGTTTVDGTPLPLAEVVGWLRDLEGWEQLDTPLRPGLGVVAARSAGRLTVLAADLTGRARRLRVAGRVLDLAPWGVLRSEGRDALPGGGSPGGGFVHGAPLG